MSFAEVLSFEVFDASMKWGLGSLQSLPKRFVCHTPVRCISMITCCGPMPVAYCPRVPVYLPAKLGNLRQDRLSRMDAEPVNRHID